MSIQEVASPIDLRDSQDAQQWAAEANLKRPWRYEFFDYYAALINRLNFRTVHVLELGSGPGFLAKHLLEKCPKIQYNAVDFSQAMHDLAQEKLTENELAQTQYYVADFKHEAWSKDLAEYDVVIIHQALHELRHKTYATNFHCQVQKLLKADAIYLVCDHVFADNAMSNNELFMSKQEHVHSLKAANFKDVDLVMEKHGLCLFEAKL